jgi:hypothetical protein
MAQSIWLANPKPAAAACYWTSWITDSRSADPAPSVHYYSSVTYRIGFTCSGLINEVNIYQTETSWYIDGNPFGYTRNFMWLQVRDGNDLDRVFFNINENIQCAQQTCVLHTIEYPNYTDFLNNGSSGLYLKTYCQTCWVGGGGSYMGLHWFVTGTIRVDLTD